MISPTGGSARIQTRVEVGVDDMFLGVTLADRVRFMRRSSLQEYCDCVSCCLKIRNIWFILTA